MLFAIPAVTAFVLFFIARRTIVDIMPRQKLPVDGLDVYKRQELLYLTRKKPVI